VTRDQKKSRHGQKYLHQHEEYPNISTNYQQFENDNCQMLCLLNITLWFRVVGTK
jgi:hypothetical protein